MFIWLRTYVHRSKNICSSAHEHMFTKKRLVSETFLGGGLDSLVIIGYADVSSTKKSLISETFLGGGSDSNRRHSEPQSDALTN